MHLLVDIALEQSVEQLLQKIIFRAMERPQSQLTSLFWQSISLNCR